ncbi:uncharacterized protein BN812_00782 [Prevotella sp. CAG:924]|nr:uncharacterized protein BN812_00782 [Prevotella sp. CAG:924]
MILFVFEGMKAEPMVFGSLERLLLSGEAVKIVKCSHDLPTLYRKLRDNDYDLFRSLPLKDNGINVPEGARLDTLFSQIFLFFDYDFQNRIGVKNVNSILEDMLDFFDNETDNGKLYINYPMIESLKYTKTLPDAHYWQYAVTRQICADHKFKGEAETFACAEAKGYKFIDLAKTPEEEVRKNWAMLREQNVRKANYIISGNNVLPDKKDDINQKAIFTAQKEKYVLTKDEVAILNSFPIFIHDYLK